MPFFPRRKSKSTKSVTFKRKGIKPTKALKSIVTRVAQGVMNKELETKYASAPHQGIAFNSIISAYSSEAYSVLPPISVQTSGMQTYNRTGNEITPLRLSMDIMVAINTVTRSCAFRVDLFVLTRKDTKYFPTIAVNSTQPKMFTTGTSTGINGYNGNNTDAMYRYNLNEFTFLKHKTFMLAGNVGLPNNDTTAGNSPNLLPGCVKHLKFTIPCPKTLKYDENPSTAATYPMNYAPFFLIGYSKVDGTGPDTGNASIVASWVTGLTFKDA